MPFKSEQLEEGWVKFTRIYCKVGWLDRWMGDSINNPNNSTKSNLQVNSIACYWRCNNNEWVHDREIGRSKIHTLIDMAEEFTAKEIWDELLIYANK